MLLGVPQTPEMEHIQKQICHLFPKCPVISCHFCISHKYLSTHWSQRSVHRTFHSPSFLPVVTHQQLRMPSPQHTLSLAPVSHCLTLKKKKKIKVAFAFPAFYTVIIKQSDQVTFPLKTLKALTISLSLWNKLIPPHLIFLVSSLVFIYPSFFNLKTTNLIQITVPSFLGG